MKFLILFIITPCFLFSQTKNKWFFGAEIGVNTIISFDNKNSFQGGLLAEYYLAKQWSLMSRLKYFNTGTTNNAETGYFEGTVISLPINLKWEYRIINNFRGNFCIGFALNQEIKSRYYYPPNENTDFSKFFGTFNAGIGFAYFIKNKTAFFVNYETYLFGNTRDSKSNLFPIIPNSTNNNIFNIGIKYNLNNIKND